MPGLHATIVLAAVAISAATATRPELAVFAPLMGNCWRGPVPGGLADTHCFASVYGGQHVRDDHAVSSRPPYRGETLYSWNAEAKRIDWAYYNSLGSVIRGTASPVPDGIDFADESGTIVSRWRWLPGGGYAVTAPGGAPVRFVRVARK